MKSAVQLRFFVLALSAVGLAALPLFSLRYPSYVLMPSELRAEAATNTLPFSARLTTTSGGNVIDGSYNVAFRIYDQVSGGVAIWSENQVVSVTRGEFSVNLGDTTSLSGVDFTQSPLYLAFQVGVDPEMTPRYEIGSVPSALNAQKSQDSDKLGGQDASKFVRNDRDETIGGNLTVTGAASLAGITATSLSASGSIQGLNLTDGTASISGGIVSGATWQGTAISPQYGGLGINTSSSTGVPSVASGTWSISSSLAATLGGTGLSSVAAGDLLIGSDLAANVWNALAVGSNGQCLIVQAGMPVWGSCAMAGSGTTMQAAYDNGATLVTTNAKDLEVTLANTVTDSNFRISVASGSTGYVAVSRADGAGAADPSQLVLVENLDTDRAQPVAIRVASASGAILTALDLSDSDIATALDAGANDLAGSDWSIQGSTGALTVGSLTTAGTVTSGAINGQTISNTAQFTGSVTVASGLAVTSGGLTVAGNSSIDGDLSVSGSLSASSLTGTVADTNLTSNVALLNRNGQTFAGTNTFSASGLALTVTNDAEIAGALTVGGGASISGGLDNNSGGIANTGAISGATNGDFSGNFTVGGTLNGATISGGLLSGGNFSGGTMSGGTVTGGSLSATDVNGLSVAAGVITSGSWQGTAVDILHGGTGANNASGARVNLSAAKSGANSDITSLSGLTTALTTAQGGTGATSFTSGGVVYGNGAGALQVTAAGTGGQLLVANASGVPAFVSLSGDATLADDGEITLADSGVTADEYGSSTQVPVLTIDSKGRVTVASTTTISGVAPGGTAAGDLSGSYPNPTVAKINGVSLGATTATAGNLLIGSGTAWVSQTVGGDATLSSSGALTISNDAITTLKVADGTITNEKLANDSLTVTAGTGLSGGGSVALGAVITLNNTGVLSLAGATDQISVSGSTGNVTLSLPQDIATSSSPVFAGLTINGNASVAGGNIGVDPGYLINLNNDDSNGGNSIHRDGASGDTVISTPLSTGISFVAGGLIGSEVARISSSGDITNAGTINSATITGGQLSGTAVNGLSVASGTVSSGTWNGATIGVGYGGTGASSFTANGLVYGNGSGALQVTAAGTSGQLLLANASGIPTFATMSGDATLAASGVLTLVNSGVTAGDYGSATSVPSFSVDSQGRITAVTETTISGVAPGGTAAGDLSGSYPNPTVAKINGSLLGVTTPTAGKLLIGDGNSWESVLMSGDATLAADGTLTVADSAVTSAKIANGTIVAADLEAGDFSTVITSGTYSVSISGNAATVTNGVYTTGSYADPSWFTSLSGSKITSGSIANSKLTNDSITVTAGTGLSGGGIVALGSNVTLTNAGLTSLNSLTADVIVAGGGINTVSINDQTITITATEVDDLASVTGRGASTATAVSLNGGATVAGGLDNSGDGIINAGAISGATTGNFSGNVTVGGTLGVTSTINGATISGGTLSGGNVSGGMLSATGVNGLSVAAGVISGGTWNGSVVGVDYGGTGASSFTSGGLLYGNGTGALQVTAAGTSGQMLLANGSGVPTFVSLSGDAEIDNLGVLTLADLGIAADEYGSGTSVPVISVDAKGRITAVSSTPITGAAPTGLASGDLSGSYPNPTVAKINGVGLGSTTATAGNVLLGSGTQWVSQTLSGDATITSAGVLTIENDAVTSLKVADGAITNSKLANDSVTVSAGTGISGGGVVALGGSITITNDGVTSLTGTTDQISVSGSTGDVTLSLPQDIATTSSPTFAGLTLTTALAVTEGGTGADNASDARANLGAAASGSNSDITSLAGITGTIAGNSTGIISGFSTINGATLSGGTLSGGNISGGTLSGTGVNGLSVAAGVISGGTWNGSTIGVSYGGTGATTFTNGGLLYGNGTGALQVTAAGTSGQLLLANGLGVPTFVSLSGDATLADTGEITLANSGVSADTYGSSTEVAVLTVDSKGRITGVTNTTITGAAPTGSAGGDLSGNFPNPTVAKINGVGLGSTTATAGNLLLGSGSQWVSQVLTGDAAITSTGVFTIENDAITTLKIADGNVTNGKLANDSITVNAGTGISGGGTVALGGNITVTNAGVTSLAGTANQIDVSGSIGDVTLSLPQNIATTSSPTFAGLSLTSALAITEGGTGATTASGARTNLGLAIGSDIQGFDATLNALAGYNSNGLMVQTAADTFAAITITGTANRLTVTNGDGVSGNPTLDISSSYVGQASITTLGTVATGVWQGTAVGAAYGGTGQTTYSDGQLLIGNSSGGLSKATLTQGTGITVTNGNGTIQIATTALASEADTLASVTGRGATTTTSVALNGGITTSSGYTQSGSTTNTFTGATTFSASGTGLAVTNSATIGGTLGVTGTVTGGTYNGQTISSSANFTGSLTAATLIQGSTGAFTTAMTTPIVYGSSSANGDLALQSNSSSADEVQTITATSAGGSATITVPATTVGAGGTFVIASGDSAATVRTNAAAVTAIGSTANISVSGSTSSSGGSDLFTGGTASADTECFGAVAANAFDGNTSTEWGSCGTSLPHWLQYDLGSGNSAIGTSYKIYFPGSFDPQTWTLKGSNTGSFSGEEVTLDTRNLGVDPGAGYQTYSFSNSTAYRYYRLNVTAKFGGGPTEVHIRQFELYSAPSTSGTYTLTFQGALANENIAQLTTVSSGWSTDTTTEGGSVLGKVYINGTSTYVDADGSLSLGTALTVANGGTGYTDYSEGELLIGNSSGGLTKTTLTAGTGISITNGDGSITIENTGSAGEINTASNVGASGVGIFKQKSTYDLEFKKLVAGSNKLTVTDNTGNSTVDLDIDTANITSLSGITGTIAGNSTGVISGFNSINGATISGGTLSGGNVSGGSLSGGTYTNSSLTGSGAYAVVAQSGNVSLQASTGVVAINQSGVNNELRLYASNGTDYGAISVNDSGELQFSGSGSNNVTIGDTGSAVDLVFAEDSSIRGVSPGKTLTIGASGDTVNLNASGVAYNLHGSTFTAGTGNAFEIDSNGNVVTINGVTTSFPSSQGAEDTVLTNNGSGVLTWAPAGGAGDITDVTAGAGLSGGGASGNVTLSLDTASTNTWSAAQTFSAAGTGLAVSNNATIGGTLSVTSTINGASISGGTVSGGTLSGGSLSGGTYTNASATGSGAYAVVAQSGNVSLQASSGIVTINQSGQNNELRLYASNGTDYASVATTSSGELVLGGTGSNNVTIGDVGTPVDLVFAENSSIRGVSPGKELSIGASGDTINLDISGVTYNIRATELAITNKLVTTPSALQAMAAAGTISPNAAKIKVAGSGGAVTLTSTPTITAGDDGQILIIQGTSDTNTVTIQDEDTMSGSGVQITALDGTTELGKGDILTLTYDATDGYWYEVSFSDN